jgi:DNA invertase Pin-like site-specific DNA recombinase
VTAAIYARVSTSNGSQTCENQLLELRRYCDARGWMVYAEYTDEISGAKDRRPGLDRLLLDARRARISVVVC